MFSPVVALFFLRSRARSLAARRRPFACGEVAVDSCDSSVQPSMKVLRKKHDCKDYTQLLSLLRLCDIGSNVRASFVRSSIIACYDMCLFAIINLNWCESILGVCVCVCSSGVRANVISLGCTSKRVCRNN